MNNGNLVLCVISIFFLGPALADESQPPTLLILDTNDLDRSADACSDFYQYACGGWHHDNPMPAAESFWSRPFTQFKREVDSYVVAEIKKSASANDVRTGDEQKIGDYYAACMDAEQIDRRGLAPIADELALIDSMQSIGDLPVILGKLQRLLPWYPQDGEPLIFLDARPVADGGNNALRIGPSGLGLGSPRYYIDVDGDGQELLSEYRQHILAMLELLGSSKAQAERDSMAVLELETALAGAYTPRSELTDNPSLVRNRMTLEELQAYTPHFNWPSFFRAHGLPDRGDVNPRDIGYLQGIDALFTEISLQDWQAYLRWTLVSERAKSLPTPIRDERFRFYGHTLLGLKEAPPRSQTCIESIKIDMPTVLGRMFVGKAFSPKMRDDAEAVFSEVKAVMRERVKASGWMQASTKDHALRKIDKTRLTVGHPPTWLDEPRVVIRRDDHYGNVLRTGESMRRVLFDRVDNRPDLNWWDEPVTWVGGYYQSAYNSIVITTAMMLAMDNPDNDPALLYAGLGVFIAHELIHGFDTGGRHYDADGNLHDWWSDSDESEFEARAQCVSDQFSAMEYAEGIPIDGTFVVAEQLTEISAQHIALEAYERVTPSNERKMIDGMTPHQRYFSAAAQTWCATATDGNWLSMANGGSAKAWGAPMVHGTVTNLPEFAKAFDCKMGQPMVKKPKDVCLVW